MKSSLVLVLVLGLLSTRQFYEYFFFLLSLLLFLTLNYFLSNLSSPLNYQSSELYLHKNSENYS